MGGVGYGWVVDSPPSSIMGHMCWVNWPPAPDGGDSQAMLAMGGPGVNEDEVYKRMSAVDLSSKKKDDSTLAFPF
jgi:hypothetical protein